jgi:formylglycine-generating enzyme required for sulfatase activity
VKRILILVAISLSLCSTASAFQGGAGESTKKGSNKKKEVTKKQDSGVKSNNTTPPRRPSPPKVQVFGPGLSVDLGHNVKLELVLIEAGSFQMGSDQFGFADEKPLHSVNISRPFYLGKYQVTQAQWQAVMSNNPSRFKNCGGNCPVENVSWDDAQEFISRLNALGDAHTYRLPTEAEWEYAARAGTTGNYGSLLGMTWDDSGNKTHPVGQKEPNAWGLYDLHGKVSEWCQDSYGRSYYQNSPGTDPQGPNSGQGHVLRGSSLGYFPGLRSAASRDAAPGDSNYQHRSFRVVAIARSQSTANVPTVVVEFPTSGSGRATKEVGLKAYLDPRRTEGRLSGPAKYVFADNPALSFDDKPGPMDAATAQRWWSMPAGNYIVYPRGVDEISFTWWLKKV